MWVVMERRFSTTTHVRVKNLMKLLKITQSVRNDLEVDQKIAILSAFYIRPHIEFNRIG